MELTIHQVRRVTLSGHQVPADPTTPRKLVVEADGETFTIVLFGLRGAIKEVAYHVFSASEE